MKGEVVVLEANDFKSEWFVPITPYLIRKVGLRDAYILSIIRFRCNTENKTVVQDEDGLWWRKGQAEWAAEMGITRRTLFAALDKLEQSGAIETRVHAENGWTDQTKSYRVVVAGEDPASIGQNLYTKPTERVQNLPTVPLFKEESLNICRSEGETRIEEPKKRGAHLLPEDFKPTDNHRVKADVLGVDIAAAEESMRRWAFAKDVRRANWNATFSTFLGKMKPSVVSVPSAESQVDRIIASGDREAMEKLTGVRFDPDFGDVSPRERFELLKVEWPGWARENRARLVSAAVSHSKPR